MESGNVHIGSFKSEVNFYFNYNFNECNIILCHPNWLKKI